MRAVLILNRLWNARLLGYLTLGRPVRYFTFFICLVICTSSVLADSCGGDVNKKVVLLEATVVPKDSVSDTKRRTGIIVSRTGLVLTVYDLIEKMKPNHLIGLTPEELDDEVTITLPGKRLREGDGTDVEATVLGHDWRRNILLLKIPALELIDDDLLTAELSRNSISKDDEVCFIGFAQNGSGNFTTWSSEEAAIRPTSGIGWMSNHQPAVDEALGGAVFDADERTLVGMIQQSVSDNNHFLPIEYADTLLSQLFIARITREIDDVRDVANQMKTGLSWGFQILENTSGNLNNSGENTLRIRFFFSQHVDEHKHQSIDVRGVTVTTLLTGETIDDDGEREQVPVELKRRKRNFNVRSDQTYFDYDASDEIADAIDQGFRSLTNIRLSIKPDFQIGPVSNMKGRKQVFDIPLQSVGQ